MKTALYIRVSTEEQAKEGFSISAQRERLTAYTKSQGWEIFDYYVDDGKSARDTDRKELRRMISDIEKGLIDVVLVYRLDRLTRSVRDLYKLLDLFDKYDCKFKSATEVYDTTTAMGRLFITIVGALAQWESENLSERVSFGMTEKARQGQWHGSDPPYGYRYFPETKEIEIDVEEATIVKKIFNLYISGYSDRKIAIFLNENGVTTRKGGPWRENGIRYILTNSAYIGNLRWGVRVHKKDAFEVEGVFPQIIDNDLYEKAQKIRIARRRFHGRQATSDYIFSGVLRCVRCGGAFKGHMKVDHNKRRYKSYRCINSLEKLCDMPLISEKIVEYQFLEYLKKVDFNVDIKSDDSGDEKENKKRIKRLNNELNKIEARKKKWQYAWVNEMINDYEFKERMAEENKKEDEIKQELSTLSKHVVKNNNDNLLNEVVSTAIERWNAMSVLEKKQLISIIIDKIVIEKVEAKTRKDRVKILEITFN